MNKRKTIFHSQKATFIQRFLARVFFFGFGYLIETENEDVLENLSEPVIFAANHNNEYETFLLAAYLLIHRKGKRVGFLIDWMYRYIPVFGWMLNKADPVYVYNKPARISWLNRFRKDPVKNNVICQCISRIRQNQSLAIFPEGTRNPDPLHLKRGRKGIAEIALITGVPVLPIGIDFPKRITKGEIPRFGPIIFRFGNPLSFDEEYQLFQEHKVLGQIEDARYDKTLGVRLCSSVHHRIMTEISQLSGKSYPFRPPEFLYEINRLEETI